MIEADDNTYFKNDDLLKQLRIQIEKGWDGPVSVRSVDDIIADKLKAIKKGNLADNKQK